ncbi:hypothetical protein Ddc_17474 [Ditylenchus destructor]|nr:hypothetical protein Ddc_17474 [Ditylenchus destructor]
MSPEPIIEEPDDFASSNGIALSGNNAAQELAVLNASGKNDLAASIAAIKVPERPAQVQSSGVSFMDFIPVVNVINRGVEAGVNCYQNNKNRESHDQIMGEHYRTARETGQNKVAMVNTQCNALSKIHSKKCDTAVKIHEQKCKTWLAAKEKDAKNRELEIKKNYELENQRIQQNALTQNLQIQADVQKNKEQLEAEVKKHKISECAKVEQHRTEKSTELAKEKVKLEETKSKNELELKALQENNALEVRKMEAEERKHERECATGLEQARIKSNKELLLALLFGMNANRRDSANDPGTSSSSSTSSPQYGM